MGRAQRKKAKPKKNRRMRPVRSPDPDLGRHPLPGPELSPRSPSGRRHDVEGVGSAGSNPAEDTGPGSAGKPSTLISLSGIARTLPGPAGEDRPVARAVQTTRVPPNHTSMCSRSDSP